MKITILSVGKIKEIFLLDGIKEFTKRLNKFSKLCFIEILDLKAPENLSEKEIESVKLKEGKKLLSHIKEDGFIFVLVINGKMISSEEFAKVFLSKTVEGISHFYFIIGGSLGLSDEVINKADFKISFSKMTFPHQLMKLILLEQVYRAFKINNKEPYHK